MTRNRARTWTALAAIVLALVIALPAAAQSKTPLKVNFLYLADDNPAFKAYRDNELKARLAKDLNLELTLTFQPWSAYGPGAKADLMMAAGEPIDMLMMDHGWLNQLVQKKLAYDLTDLTAKFAPELKKNMPPESFANFTFNNKLYALPVGGKPTASVFYSICVRQDLLEEVGMKGITSIADLEKFADLALAKHPGMYATYDFNIEEYLRGYSNRLLTTQYGNSGIMANEDTGELVPFIETPEFKAHVDFMARLYAKGQLPKDILTNKTTNPFESGNLLWFRGTALTTVYENEPALRKNVPTARTKEYIFNPTAAKFKAAYESTAFMVPVYSKNAEAVTRLVNYMQSGADAYNAFVYGLEGRDFRKVDDTRIHRNTTTDFFYNWMLFNIKFPVFEENVPASFVADYKHWEDNARASKWMGFSVDLANIKTEKARIDAVWGEKVVPMLAGLVPYAQGIDGARKALNDAGWAKYFAEYQAQFKASLASKK